MASELVSVIIPSYEARDTLYPVLESLSNQTHEPIEVLVVDRPSGDGTRELVRSYGFEYVPLDTERTAAVNDGARRGSGDYIYYIGADHVLEPDVIERAVATSNREDADAVVIPNLIDPDGFWPKVRWLEKQTYLGDDTVEAARFFDRDVFEELGGYDEDLVAYEEHDLHDRLLDAGYSVARVDSAVEYNVGEPRSLWTYVRKNFYYGRTMHSYVNKSERGPLSRASPVRSAHLRHFPLFSRHPVLAIGFVVFQLARYSAAGVGYLSEVLARLKENVASSTE